MKKHQKGFTLIEVMVALVIFVIVGLLAAQGLKILLRSHDTIRIESNRLEELQIGLALMNQNITQTIDRSILNEQNTSQNAFMGQSNYMEFTHGGYMNPQAKELRSTLQRTAYLIDNGKLIQRNWPVLDRTAKTLPVDRILLNDVKDLRFRYFDAKSQQYDSWPPANLPNSSATTTTNNNNNNNNFLPQNLALPRAVQITLTVGHMGVLRRVFIIPGQTLSEN